MKKYQKFVLREFKSKKTAMTTRKNLFAFISKQHAEKYSRIVRYCNIIRNTVSICNDPDTSKRIDKGNPRTAKITSLVSMGKLFLILATGVILAELQIKTIRRIAKKV